MTSPPLRIGPPHPQGPVAAVSRRAAERLREGSVWVYRSDVEQVAAAVDAEDPGAGPAAGSIVSVIDNRGIPLGSALFSAASQIALRMVSASAGLTRAEYLVELEERIREAVSLRAALAPTTSTDDACRLIFSEADRLPGIVADRYNDLVVVQLLTQATAQADVRRVLAETLAASLVPAPRLIVERSDPRIRQAEQLGLNLQATLAGGDGEPMTDFHLNGLRFGYDANAGQKTGAFLDQRLNYAAAANHARGRALDVCTYQGGFALHLARTCERVTGVDSSRAALEVADANLGRNRQAVAAQVDWMEADAFELLREYDSAGQRYDTIVLDPPAFAKTRRAAESATRGYKELNLRALRMLAPGGTLVTCSCSHHVGLAEFLEVVRAAAQDAGRRVQVLEMRGAAPDHPAIVTLPETSYLKCLLCRVG